MTVLEQLCNEALNYNKIKKALSPHRRKPHT